MSPHAPSLADEHLHCECTWSIVCSQHERAWPRIPGSTRCRRSLQTSICRKTAVIVLRNKWMGGSSDDILPVCHPHSPGNREEYANRTISRNSAQRKKREFVEGKAMPARSKRSTAVNGCIPIFLDISVHKRSREICRQRSLLWNMGLRDTVYTMAINEDELSQCTTLRRKTNIPARSVAPRRICPPFAQS